MRPSEEFGVPTPGGAGWMTMGARSSGLPAPQASMGQTKATAGVPPVGASLLSADFGKKEILLLNTLSFQTDRGLKSALGREDNLVTNAP